ncbi:MAG TPA: toll/interleukin-1 receptor domain-containing protein [Myxococcales bacterium]|nr:toll/interleukin-1 receptor domain-containing protein [Myxococcales bacterium]
MEIFISFSHSDGAAKDMLCKHLSSLAQDGLIHLWDDRQLSPGEWEDEIQDRLDRADVVLLLVSSDYISSRFCTAEALRALERDDAGECFTVPIILRECDWTTRPWARLVSLPTDGRAVMSNRWHSPDEAFTDVARRLRAWVIKRTETRRAC